MVSKEVLTQVPCAVMSVLCSWKYLPGISYSCICLFDKCITLTPHSTCNHGGAWAGKSSSYCEQAGQMLLVHEGCEYFLQ